MRSRAASPRFPATDGKQTKIKYKIRISQCHPQKSFSSIQRGGAITADVVRRGGSRAIRIKNQGRNHQKGLAYIYNSWSGTHKTSDQLIFIISKSTIVTTTKNIFIIILPIYNAFCHVFSAIFYNL